MTILVADDHPMFRRAVIQILQPEFTTAKFHQADNGQQVMTLVQAEEIDVLLLDIQMPVMNGYDVVDILRHQKPKTKIIVSSLIDSLQAVDHFFAKGVKGYLSKSADPEEYVEGIKVVMAGGVCIQKSLTKSPLYKEAAPANLKFSPQETLVLRHLSEGLSAAEIGRAMGLSARTVEDYKANIMKKAQVKNTAELVRFFYENGLN